MSTERIESCCYNSIDTSIDTSIDNLLESSEEVLDTSIDTSIEKNPSLIATKDLFKMVTAIHNNSQPESFVKILSFLNETQSKFEPAIFNLNIDTDEGVFSMIFRQLIKIIRNNNMFSSFDFLGKSFTRAVKHIMVVDKNISNLLINPQLITRDRFNNDFFNIEIINNMKTTDSIREYIETNRFTFTSYFKTISDKKKFSYSTRRDMINNKKLNPTITSVGDDYIHTESSRVKNQPWLITRKVTKFKIQVDGDKCISGGRPGIPGSIYFTLSDRTSVILFKRGTCLIVGSKDKDDSTMITFMKKTFFNIFFQLNIYLKFIESNYHTIIFNFVNSIVSRCSVCKEKDIPCDECLLKTAVRNEIEYSTKYMFTNDNNDNNDNNSNNNSNNSSTSNSTIIPPDGFETQRMINVSIEYIRNYKKYYEIFLKDKIFLKKLIKSIINISPYDYLNNLQEYQANIQSILTDLTGYIDQYPLSILAHTKVAVFGLRRKEPIYSGVFLQIPASHKKHISMFNGNRITYRSLKTSYGAKLLIELYDRIINEIKDLKLYDNIYSLSPDKIYDMFDKYTMLYNEYRD
jgi:hypothetical protein